MKRAPDTVRIQSFPPTTTRWVVFARTRGVEFLRNRGKAFGSNQLNVYLTPLRGTSPFWTADPLFVVIPHQRIIAAAAATAADSSVQPKHLMTSTTWNACPTATSTMRLPGRSGANGSSFRAISQMETFRFRDHYMGKKLPLRWAVINAAGTAPPWVPTSRIRHSNSLCTPN